MSHGTVIAAGAAAGEDVVWHRGHVSPASRRHLFGHEPATVWLTGLSGAGKSTVAFELERQLHARGRAAYVLDGDNVRHGLCRDLGFSHEDRSENIRRVAEVARLFNDAGLLVIAAFISPYRQDREMARSVIGERRFLETHLSADIGVCERRDPKGLYRKARAGMVADFTGVSAPYELPEAPALRIDTGRLDVGASVAAILELLAPRLTGVLP